MCIRFGHVPRAEGVGVHVPESWFDGSTVSGGWVGYIVGQEGEGNKTTASLSGEVCHNVSRICRQLSKLSARDCESQVYFGYLRSRAKAECVRHEQLCCKLL